MFCVSGGGGEGGGGGGGGGWKAVAQTKPREHENSKNEGADA